VTEEILEFENTVEDEDGRSHVAVVLAEERDDGKWVGRVRFTPVAGAASIETGAETTQPKREYVVYWAKGLTYSYLEGALVRALRGPPGAARAARTADASGAQAMAPARRGVPRLEVASLDPGIVEKLMGTVDPQPGTARVIENAGIIVYEGTGGADGASHMFAVQYGSNNAGALLTNWLWSRLHGVGAEVRVQGQRVELTNDALKRALVD